MFTASLAAVYPKISVDFNKQMNFIKRKLRDQIRFQKYWNYKSYDAHYEIGFEYKR